MESSSDTVLQDTLHKAQKDVRELLMDVQSRDLDRKKLETRLREVQKHLEIVDIHVGKHK